MPIDATRSRKSAPYTPSRSRSRWRGAVSHGNASTICCAVHAAAGCAVMLKCRTRRRSWARTTSTNRTSKTYRGDSEEVDRDEVRGVIGEERSPGRRHWLESTDPVLLDRRLRDFDAEFAKLTYDAW